ncbi:MAG: hydrogenase maturation nickel metallochaperone HypA [Solirubrobacterales bacterium]
MHELSIARAVAAVAERHAGGRRVVRVELRVGHLRQVVPAALEWSWQVVCEGTALDGAELAIAEVPARVRCRGCGTETEVAGFPLGCGGCGGRELDVVAGEELEVEALEVEDPVASVDFLSRGESNSTRPGRS